MRYKLDEEIAKPMTATPLMAAWVAFIDPSTGPRMN